ncbi:MAG: HAD family phosphatase [Patescibacteria group bacterium]|jgi:HAD superfamily hydrolase (TIGR01509 family)
MIRAIFFDIDNVLLKSGFRKGIRQYERRYRLPRGSVYVSMHNRKYWKDFTLGKISEKDYLKKVSADYPGGLNMKVLQRFIRSKTKLLKKTLSLARQLRSKFIVGIISNHPREWWQWSSKKFKLSKTFKVVAISGIVHTRKPDPKIFRYALKKARVRAKESVYIDDRPDIIKGASSIGIHPVIFKNAAQLKKELERIVIIK